jgi:hypothetical protein
VDHRELKYLIWLCRGLERGGESNLLVGAHAVKGATAH